MPKPLEKLESYVNDHIRQNVPVGTQEMEMQKAMGFRCDGTVRGKNTVTGVRVVSAFILQPGTFVVERTPVEPGDIGLFTILSESSIASGVRRTRSPHGKFCIGSCSKKTVEPFPD